MPLPRRRKPFQVPNGHPFIAVTIAPDGRPVDVPGTETYDPTFGHPHDYWLNLFTYDIFPAHCFRRFPAMTKQAPEEARKNEKLWEWARRVGYALPWDEDGFAPGRVRRYEIDGRTVFSDYLTDADRAALAKRDVLVPNGKRYVAVEYGGAMWREVLDTETDDPTQYDAGLPWRWREVGGDKIIRRSRFKKSAAIS